MIYKALELVRQNLEDYINKDKGDDDDNHEKVDLGNVALLDVLADSSGLPNILISLVNIEEEFTLRNNAAYRKVKLNGQVDYQNPPVFINLYMLISANHTEYKDALKNLSKTILFFQSKKKFTISNSFNPDRATDNELSFKLTEELLFQLNIELYSLTFEQINHLWGSLGGRQAPFVLYKIRILELEDKIKQKEGKTIETVIINKE